MGILTAMTDTHQRPSSAPLRLMGLMERYTYTSLYLSAAAAAVVAITVYEQVRATL